VASQVYWNKLSNINKSFSADLELTTIENADVIASSTFPTLLEMLTYGAIGIYIIGVLFMTLRMTYGLNKIYRLYKHSIIKSFDGYKLVLTKTNHLPFSFFKFLFVNTDQYQSANFQKILIHENIHIRQLHSFDILFIELLQIVFWFNPILIFYKNHIRLNHEFLADIEVLSQYDIQEYKNTLLTNIEEGLQLKLTNQFFQSQIKTRLKMMNTNNTIKTKTIRYFGILPIMFVLVALFSQNNVKTNINPDEVYQEIAELRKECYQKDISTAISLFKNYYREKVAAADKTEIKSLQNTITAQGAKNGMRITFEDERSFRDLQFVVPFENLEDYKAGKTSGAYDQMIKGNTFADDMYANLRDEDKTNDPLIIIDGKESTLEDLKDIKASTLTQMTANKAIEIYGTNAKNGAMVIETKSDNMEDQEVQNPEDLPRFPGCEDVVDIDERKTCSMTKLIEFLSENVVYPEDAKKNNIEGMNVVKFVVAKDGTLENIHLVKDIGHGTGESTMNAIKAMNEKGIKWIPGKQRGEIVKVEFALPIKYQLGPAEKKGE
jgi:TonB family protein